jgi:hypothetical protein
VSKEFPVTVPFGLIPAIPANNVFAAPPGYSNVAMVPFATRTKPCTWKREASV